MNYPYGCIDYFCRIFFFFYLDECLLPLSVGVLHQQTKKVGVKMTKIGGSNC